MPLSTEDLAEITKLMEAQMAGLGNTINAAVTSQLKRVEPKHAEAVQAAVDAALAKQREEQEQQREEQQGKNGNAPNDKNQNGQPHRDPEAEKRALALEKQVLALQKALEDGNTQRAAAEKRAREQGAQSRLSSALSKVKPEVKDLLAKAWQADGKVTFDADGNPMLRVRKSPVKGLPEEDMELPLEEGVAHWLSTKEAEAYLPPPTGPRGTVQSARTAPAPFAARAPITQPSNGASSPFDEDAAALRSAEVLLGNPAFFSNDE